ncbi:MAG TPA: hypothetical protein PKM73_06230 [Verrucomicrobiota bacterium]|nr:hypothetical protein [Verrucomicrobiota bacterium]HNU51011.1 hypothetical protein [Verrucomicrobiota bacterium]
MNTTPSPTPLSDRYVTLRLCRWLVDPLRLRIYLWAALCLITLIAVAYAAVNWHGARVWAARRASLEAAGVRLELASFIPPRVPDEQNFTMTPLLAPLFDFKPGTQEWRDTNTSDLPQKLNPMRTDGPKGGWRSARGTDWEGWIDALNLKNATNATVSPPQAVLDHLRPWDSMLAQVREASRRPAARFNAHYEHEPAFEILLPHLGILRGWCRVLALRASSYLALGNPEAAYEDIALGLYLAQTVREEPLLISHLVHGACVQSLAQPLWEGLSAHRWTDSQIRALQESLEQVDLWSGMQRTLNAERAFSSAMLDYIREHPSILPTLGDSSGNPFGAAAMLFTLIPSGWLRLEQAEYHRLYQEALSGIGDPARRHVDPAPVVEATSRVEAEVRQAPLRNHRVFARMLIPGIAAVVSKTAYNQSVADQMALACALERYRWAHNRWPETLDAMVPDFARRIPTDGIRGEPLHYAVSGTGYTLYSIGWNGTDDGGRPGQDDKGRWSMSAGDWVWRIP